MSLKKTLVIIGALVAGLVLAPAQGDEGEYTIVDIDSNEQPVLGPPLSMVSDVNMQRVSIVIGAVNVRACTCSRNDGTACSSESCSYERVPSHPGLPGAENEECVGVCGGTSCGFCSEKTESMATSAGVQLIADHFNSGGRFY